MIADQKICAQVILDSEMYILQVRCLYVKNHKYLNRKYLSRIYSFKQRLDLGQMTMFFPASDLGKRTLAPLTPMLLKKEFRKKALRWDLT